MKKTAILTLVLIAAFAIAMFAVVARAQTDTPTDTPTDTATDTTAPVDTSVPTSTSAPNSVTIIVLAGDGGTTDPAPGTYTYTEGVNGSAVLTATPNEGNVFLYWQYFGYSPGHAIFPSLGQSFLDQINQIQSDTIDVTHNYNTEGFVYEYQPVFVSADLVSGSASVSSGVPVIYVAAIAAALAAVIIVASVVAFKAGKKKA